MARGRRTQPPKALTVGGDAEGDPLPSSPASNAAAAPEPDAAVPEADAPEDFDADDLPVMQHVASTTDPMIATAILDSAMRHAELNENGTIECEDIARETGLSPEEVRDKVQAAMGAFGRLAARALFDGDVKQYGTFWEVMGEERRADLVNAVNQMIRTQSTKPMAALLPAYKEILRGKLESAGMLKKVKATEPQSPAANGTHIRTRADYWKAHERGASMSDLPDYYSLPEA